MNFLNRYKEVTKDGLNRTIFEVNKRDCLFHPEIGEFPLNYKNPQKIVLPKIRELMPKHSYDLISAKNNPNYSVYLIKYNDFIRIKDKKIIYNCIDTSLYSKFFKENNLQFFERAIIPVNLTEKEKQDLKEYKINQLQNSAKFYLSMRNQYFHANIPMTTGDAYRTFMSECREYGVDPNNFY
jgi:hypothetical protein